MVNSRQEQAFLDQLHTIFASLQPEEVEQFSAAYRQWLLQQRIVELRQRLAALQEHIGENELRIQQHRPSPIALASIARLQANGVSDIDLLDQMLERGEAWLDSTMQHLDYFEQFENFLSDDYTQWCRRALEGAFDWLDSLLMGGVTPSPVPPAAGGDTASGEDAGEAEAILLQKLTTEAGDDELAEEEPTLKQAVVKLPARDDAQPLQSVGEDAPLETDQVETGQELEMGEAKVGEEEETRPDETLIEDEAITASELPSRDEAIAMDEESASAEDMQPSEEPHTNGASAEVSAEVEDEQPALDKLAPIEQAETNGTSDTSSEQPAVNGQEEQPSPPIVHMTVKRKHGVMSRLVRRLLGG